MKSFILLSFTVLFFALPHSVLAATYYVSPSGSNNNSGTQSAPFSTIQHAANIVNPGDTVVVKNGTYREQVLLKRSGTQSNPIIFRSEEKWGAKIQGDTTSWRGLGFYVQADHIIISNFEITGGGTGVQMNGPTSTMDNLQGPKNIQIIGNHIHNIGRICPNELNPIPGHIARVGIYAGNSQNISIQNNVIHDIGHLRVGQNGCTQAEWSGIENLDHGIYVKQSKGIVITNNVVYRNLVGWGVHFHGGVSDFVEDALIANNTFAEANPSRQGFVILSINVKNVRVVNNLFYKPNKVGVDLYSNRTYQNTVLENNLIDGGTTYQWRSGAVSGLTSRNNFENVSAGLKNPNGLDFSLNSNSQAINNGVTLSEVKCSIDAVPRPQGAGYDIGAYEFGGTSNPSQCGSGTPTVTNTNTPTVSPNPSATNTATPIPTVTQPTGDGISLQPTKDTFVDGSSPTTNFGTLAYLASDGDKTSSNEPVNISYLQFSLPNIQKSNISQAMLELHVSTQRNGSDSTDPHDVRLVTDTSWQETGMTFQNKPSRNQVLSTITSASTGQVVRIDLTSALRQHQGNEFALAIDSQFGDSLIIDSKESALPPRLHLTLSGTGSVCAGDLNGDRTVDLLDYSILIKNFFSTSFAPGDLNQDGVVDLTDYSQLVNLFFQSCS